MPARPEGPSGPPRPQALPVPTAACKPGDAESRPPSPEPVRLEHGNPTGRATTRQYLTSQVGAVAFKQHRHIAASRAVDEGEKVAGPLRTRGGVQRGPGRPRQHPRRWPLPARRSALAPCGFLPEPRTEWGPEAGRREACSRPCGSAGSRSSPASPSAALGRALRGSTRSQPRPTGRRGAPAERPAHNAGHTRHWSVGREASRRPAWGPGDTGALGRLHTHHGDGGHPHGSIETRQRQAGQPHLGAGLGGGGSFTNTHGCTCAVCTSPKVFFRQKSLL